MQDGLAFLAASGEFAEIDGPSLLPFSSDGWMDGSRPGLDAGSLVRPLMPAHDNTVNQRTEKACLKDMVRRSDL